MSRTLGQWSRFLGACAAVGFLISVLSACPGMAKEDARSQVRMEVDFTVLPVVLPDGSEAPPPADPDAMEGEASLPPDSADPQQAAVEPEKPAMEQTPPPVPEPEPEPAPKPKPAPDPVAANAPGIVKSVELDENGDGFTITVRANREIGDTSYLNLDNPRRLVVDLRDGWTLNVKNVVRSKGRIKHIVIGEHPDRLRLVVHFNANPGGRLVPDFSRDGATLRIRVAYP